MPVDPKRAKKQVTFALAIVKSSVISDRGQSSKIEAALQFMFPGVSIILVAEDGEPANYQRRHELSAFIEGTACKVIPSSRIIAN
jgi:hypothetical protein